MDDVILTIYPILKTFGVYATKLISQVLKIIYPIANSLFTQSPDLASLALLLIIFYISLLILQQTTRFIYSLTRNLFRLFLLGLVVIVSMNYYNKRAGGRVLDDGDVIQGFDWDATWQDIQGFWGLVKNMGSVVMDLMESGSNLEEDGWNQGRRKTVGRKGDPMWSDGPSRRGPKANNYKPR